jgi:hypothetical protein
MAEFARVDSIDVIRTFRVALIKFQESANVALADAESEMTRTLMWLEGEQQTHWTHQLRMRTEAVAAAKDKVRQKKLFKDSSGKTPSAADEEKALHQALRKQAEAQEKLDATRKWARRLQREVHNFKGGIQRLATAVVVDVPNAVARLEKISGRLEQYVESGPARQPTEAELAGTGLSAGAMESMARRDNAPELPKVEEDIASRPDFPKVTEPQVVLARLEGAQEGQPASDKITVPAEANFVVCPSLDEATLQASARSAIEPDNRYAIFDGAGKLLRVIGEEG